MESDWQKDFVLDLEEIVESSSQPLITCNCIVEFAQKWLHNNRVKYTQLVIVLCWRVWDEMVEKNWSEQRLQAHLSIGRGMTLLIEDYANQLRMGS